MLMDVMLIKKTTCSLFLCFLSFVIYTGSPSTKNIISSMNVNRDSINGTKIKNHIYKLPYNNTFKIINLSMGD